MACTSPLSTAWGSEEDLRPHIALPHLHQGVLLATGDVDELTGDPFGSRGGATAF